MAYHVHCTCILYLRAKSSTILKEKMKEKGWNFVLIMMHDFFCLGCPAPSWYQPSIQASEAVCWETWIDETSPDWYLTRTTHWCQKGNFPYLFSLWQIVWMISLCNRNVLNSLISPRAKTPSLCSTMTGILSQIPFWLSKNKIIFRWDYAGCDHFAKMLIGSNHCFSFGQHKQACLLKY